MESKPSYQRQDAVSQSDRERPKGTLTGADKGWIVETIAEYWQRYSDLLRKGNILEATDKTAQEATSRAYMLLAEAQETEAEEIGQETAPSRTIYIYVYSVNGLATRAFYSEGDALEYVTDEFGEKNVHWMHTNDDRYTIGYVPPYLPFTICQVPLVAVVE